MATKKQTPAPAADADPLGVYTGTITLDANDNAGPPTGQAVQQQHIQTAPIGVPYYAVDHQTGEILRDDAGNPMRYTVPRSMPPPGMSSGLGSEMHTVGVLPKYYEGDAAEILGNMDPLLLADLQAHMVEYGLFGSRKPNITYQYADNDTITAFTRVLTTANSTGQTYQEVLRKLAQIPPEDRPKFTEAKAPDRITNTEDLVAVMKNASRNALGREISDDQARAFAQAYQSAERSYNSQVNAIAEAGLGGEVMSPPDPSSMANASLKANYGAEKQTYDLTSQVATFRSLLAGGSAR